MKLSTKSTMVGAVLTLALSFVFVPHIFAHEGDHDTPVAVGETAETTEASETPKTGRDAQKRTESSRSGEVEDEKDETQGELRKEEARKKLDDKKKAACEARESTVTKAIENVTTRSKNHFERISTIYEQTTKFYTDKGLTVANYDALVAAVETAKTTATTANQELVSFPAFSCSSDGPKADVQEFRNKRLDKVAAFASYRTAVKELVAAVKDAAKAAEATATSTTEGTN